jgi:hypothetical protein
MAAFHRVEGPARDRAEGEVVTVKWRIRRRSWDMINSTYSTRNVAVGTTKKSIATMSLTWFSRNERQV